VRTNQSNHASGGKVGWQAIHNIPRRHNCGTEVIQNFKSKYRLEILEWIKSMRAVFSMGCVRGMINQRGEDLAGGVVERDDATNLKRQLMRTGTGASCHQYTRRNKRMWKQEKNMIGLGAEAEAE
jgi:hypothetical protein